MAATAFATSEPLEPLRARSRRRSATPGRRRWQRRLSFEGAKTRRAAETLGLATVEDLLLHLPRDRREARAVAELVPGDSATVVVQVRSISSRSVRRRGMRPLVEATVADDSGAMKATFFNQPWLEQRYPVGTRLALHGKFEGAAAASGSRPTRGPATRSRRRRDRSRTTRPPRACPRPRSSRSCASTRARSPTWSSRCRRAVRVRERLPDRVGGADRGALRRTRTRGHRARAPPAGVRRAAARAARAPAPAAAPAGASTAPVLDGERELTARWLAEMLPFTLTGDQSARARGGRSATSRGPCRCSGC